MDYSKIAAMVCCLYAASIMAVEAGDDLIKSTVVRSQAFRHAEDQDRVQKMAFRLANSDTNRFVRLMKDLVAEDVRTASTAVLLIGEYGGANESDFIYAVASRTNSNVDARASALESIIRQADASALMLSSVRDYVCDQSVVDWSRRLLYLDLISRRKDELLQLGLNREWRTMLVDGAASSLDKYFFYEEEIVKHSPEYKRSRERRDLVNRVAASHAVEGNVYAMTALTNALEELSRIPENEFVDFIPSGAETRGDSDQVTDGV